MGFRGNALSEAERGQIRLMGKQGWSDRAIGEFICRSPHAVRAVLRPGLGVANRRVWDPSPARLSLADREDIDRGLVRGDTFSAIALMLGRSVSTVSREVNGNGGRDAYRAWKAHQDAGEAARRPKIAKLAGRPALLEVVSLWLEQLWSPEEIAARLRIDFAHDPMMWVSHETIYQSLYVQGRGALRKELAECLRTGRAARRAQGRMERRGQMPEMVMISERPAEVEDRAVPGHWEGDLIKGAFNRSAVGTLVERSTRYVLLLHLPDGFSAEQVRVAMMKAIKRLPEELWQSVTWDQGPEMAQHRQFTIDTGIDIFFCEPHKPWQRGSNENTNGLLRQFMPKGTDLSVHNAEDLRGFERSLNGRPRETLGWLKPCEKLAQVLALTV